MRAAFFSIFIWILFAANAANAQQYFFTGYTPRNGLVNNRVSSIFQDSKGRMYFGTYGGLSVYDGVHFLNYTTGDGLASGLINDIVEMGDDSIWIIPNGRMLQCLVHGILRNIVTADGYYPVINQLLRCSDGHFYAISDDGLFRLEKNRFIRVPLTDSSGKECGKYLNHGIEFHRKLILINDRYLENVIRPASLLIYDPETRKLTLSTDRTGFYGVLESPSQDILLNTDMGIRKLDTAALNEHHIRLLPPPYPYIHTGSQSFRCLYFDHSGALWLATSAALLRVDTAGILQTFAPLNGLPALSVNLILQDRENSMWFGSDQDGVLKLVNRQLQFYSQVMPGFRVSDLTCHNDSVWMYDPADRRLLLIKKDARKLFLCQGALPPAGRILIGPTGEQSFLVCRNSIYTLQFQGSRFSTILLYQDSIPFEGTLCFDNNGHLVIASNMLIVLAGKTILRTGLPSLCDQVAVDKENHLWVITRSDQLLVYTLDNTSTGRVLRCIRRYDNLIPGASPRSAVLDNAGRLWVGTRDHGLFCMEFDKEKIVSRLQVTMPDGLSENFVDYLYCDSDNYIWIGTPTGLDRACLRGGHIMVENITPCNEHYAAIFKIAGASDHTCWALAGGGCIRVTRETGDNPAIHPGIIFSRIDVVDHNTLNFLVGAPTFMNEGLTRYSYLLEGGRNKTWSIPATRADIDLVNLSPGKYSLYVKAEFLNGRYPQASAVYSFVIQPPWWQTWWFRIGAGIACVLLIGWWVRYYVRSRLEIQRTRLERVQAVEKERTRIASDMHDDLGAGLSQIKFLSETIQVKRQAGKPVQEELGNIGRYAAETIEKMGEIVWALNEKNDSLSNLLCYTRRFAVDYLMQCGIGCTVDMQLGSAAARFVDGEFRRNIFLTVKEALHNIVKHSGARQVRISITADKELTISISDNGIGFDPARTQRPGNGLGNMYRRMRTMGGRLKILACEGTVVQVEVPLPE